MLILIAGGVPDVLIDIFILLLVILRAVMYIFILYGLYIIPLWIYKAK
jgi:hypothetical protein